MTAEEIFYEVLKSPELRVIFDIPESELAQAKYDLAAKHKVIEIVRVIIRGEENNSDKDKIFKIIQNHIMQL